MTRKRDSKKFLKAIGARLSSIRKDRKVEIETVAKAVGISDARMLRIERGDYDMYLDLLFVICDYYETTPHDLLKDIQNI